MPSSSLVLIQANVPADPAPRLPADWWYNKLFRNSADDFADPDMVPIQICAQEQFIDNPGPGTWYYRIAIVDRSGNETQSGTITVVVP